MISCYIKAIQSVKLLKKNQKRIGDGNVKKNTRSIVNRIKALLWGVFAFAMLAYLIEMVPICVGEFSSGRWNRHPSLRIIMLKDMEEEIGIWDLSKDEIIQILGTRSMWDWPDEERNRLEYGVGKGKYYFLSFCQNGKVFKTSIFEGS